MRVKRANIPQRCLFCPLYNLSFHDCPWETDAIRLRQLEVLVPDPEAAARFFEDALGMTQAAPLRRGVCMSDGTMNLALLRADPEQEKMTRSVSEPGG